MIGVPYVVVTTTVAKKTDAQKLARLILESRLAACVQCERIESVYRWKGKIESAAEFRLTAKTRAALVAPLQTFIRANHAYELPEIVVTPIVAGLPPYLEWVATETLGARGRAPRRAGACATPRHGTPQAAALRRKNAPTDVTETLTFPARPTRKASGNKGRKS